MLHRLGQVLPVPQRARPRGGVAQPAGPPLVLLRILRRLRLGRPRRRPSVVRRRLPLLQPEPILVEARRRRRRRRATAAAAARRGAAVGASGRADGGGGGGAGGGGGGLSHQRRAAAVGGGGDRQRQVRRARAEQRKRPNPLVGDRAALSKQLARRLPLQIDDEAEEARAAQLLLEPFEREQGDLAAAEGRRPQRGALADVLPALVAHHGPAHIDRVPPRRPLRKLPPSFEQHAARDRQRRLGASAAEGRRAAERRRFGERLRERPGPLGEGRAAAGRLARRLAAGELGGRSAAREALAAQRRRRARAPARGGGGAAAVVRRGGRVGRDLSAPLLRRAQVRRPRLRRRLLRAAPVEDAGVAGGRRRDGRGPAARRHVAARRPLEERWVVDERRLGAPG